MYVHFVRNLVALFFLFPSISAFSQFITLHRDVLLCPGEVLTLNGINYFTSDTTNVYLTGVPPAPDTLIFYRIRVLENVENTEVCNCHPASFFKTFGRDNQPESGTALARTGDDNLYLAGLKNGKTFIQKMNRFGEQIWIREFSLGAFDAVTPVEIFEDSEGMIVGCGTQGLAAGLRKGFIFRYDPETNAFLWSRTISGADAVAAGILEAEPGGDYLYYQNLMFSGGDSDPEIMKIDRASGNIVPGFAQRYEHKRSDVLRKLVSVNGLLFGTGWSADSNHIARRQMLVRFNFADGAPVWNRLSHLDTAAAADLYGRDLVVDGNTLVAAYDGDEHLSQAGISNAFFLQKTDLDGNLLWLKKYDLLGNVLSLLSVSDGYVLYGSTITNGRYVIKTDKNGVPVWSRTFEYGPGGMPVNNLSGPGQAYGFDGSLLFTGMAGTGNNDVFLLNMTADGLVADSCDVVQSQPAFSFEDVVSPVRTNVPLHEKPAVGVGSANVVPWQVTSQFETLLCPGCVEPDPCPARNDFVIDMSATTCSDGEVNLQLSICDLDGGALPALIDVTFYDGNPVAGAAQTLGNYQFPTGSSDSCITVTLDNLAGEFGTAAAQNGFEVFAVVNFDGLLGTPFSFNDFPVTNLEECNYTNNLDSFTIVLPPAPDLDLGPDRTICAGEKAILTQGPIFYKYLWSNNLTNDTIVVTQSGQYRLTITDVCGIKQSDTINVQVNAHPTLTVNATICPGHPTEIHGITFTHGGVFVDTLQAGTGCDTVATFFITQLPYQERDVQVPFCNTVTINGVTYDESGLALDTLPGISGCDTIVFYFLNQLPKHLRFDTIHICPGGSVTINGHVYTQPGLIIDTIPSMDGIACDTLIRQPLVFLPQVVLNQTIEFCPGDTVTLGGQFYTQPGAVTGSLPGFGDDCDTIVQYTLQYVPLQTSNLSVSCPPDVEVVVPGGTSGTAVNYAAPIANSNCICPGTDLQLSSGFVSGAVFPTGVTTVCYSADDRCNAPVSCCFEVRVTEEDDPCDTKTIACIRYDLMSITSDPAGQYTYRVRVTNNCTNKLIYTAIQLPDGLTAVGPVNGVFTSPEGRAYDVRNPNYSPFYSIRFKSANDSIAAGQTATFEYTLPEQTHPTFIHVISRLAPQVFHEAHLNTFACPVGDTPAQNRSDESTERSAALQPADGVLLYPNPGDGEFFVDVSHWGEQVLQVRVLDGLGRVVQVSTERVAQDVLSIRMPEQASAGLYFVEIRNGHGERKVGRFVLRQGK